MIFPLRDQTYEGPQDPLEGFLDHEHIKIFLMKGQTFIWVNDKLVIKLLKHSHFFTNFLKLQILASYNNLRI